MKQLRYEARVGVLDSLSPHVCRGVSRVSRVIVCDAARYDNSRAGIVLKSMTLENESCLLVMGRTTPRARALTFTHISCGAFHRRSCLWPLESRGRRPRPRAARIYQIPNCLTVYSRMVRVLPGGPEGQFDGSRVRQGPELWSIKNGAG